jgi:hypothetical protein
LGAPHDSSTALAQYAEDYQSAMARGPVHQSKMVSLDQLRLSQGNYFRKAGAKNRKLVLKTIPACTAYLHDLKISVRISFRDSLKVIDLPAEKTDIILSADSLQYCYSYDWGGDTLAVNGRYRVPAGGHPDRFFWNFRPGMYNATGHRVGYRFLLSQVVKRGAQKIRK